MSLVPTILYFIACFAAGWYFCNYRIAGKELKKLAEEIAKLRAAKAELDRITSPEPGKNTEVSVSTDRANRSLTVRFLDLGMKSFDRVIVTAPGRKERVVLLRPWSRKMAKVNPSCKKSTSSTT